MGDLSAHFDYAELGIDRHDHSRGPVDPELVAILEALRAIDGRPLSVLSGFRSQATNRMVGGARQSQHLVGRAADIAPGRFTVAQALGAGARGIGYCGGWVVHVDSRRTRRPVIFEDCGKGH